MRHLSCVMILVMCSMPLPAAEEGEAPAPCEFDLGLASWAGQMNLDSPVDLQLDTVWMQDRRPFDAASALDMESAREYRVALWDAPLGRTIYAMAADEAMLGREGLVHGGRMLGLGLATTALGDGSHGGGINILTDGRATWAELSAGEKFQVGLEASIAAGILFAIFDGLD